ncbi:uncharacterized protein LOC135953761 [Calliphora vicina]|uniref:uncharacterized protein LOC135953761 n=1 Tax=Calliphora vicina TaxID=7373 RepID=UPI00325BEAE3
MKLICLFVLIAALYEVHAGTKRMCGPMLVQVLESVCTNGYNSMITKKSGNISLHNNELDIMDMYNDIEDDAPVHSKTSFLDDLLMGGDHVNTFAKTRRRRNLLGIYDECCVKGCNFAELTSYFLVVSSTTNGDLVLRLCGQALNEVLGIVCDGNLNGLPVKKFDPAVASINQPNNFLLSDNDCKFINKLTITRRRRYNMVGIYDECCRTKGCTVKELQSYCL